MLRLAFQCRSRRPRRTVARLGHRRREAGDARARDSRARRRRSGVRQVPRAVSLRGPERPLPGLPQRRRKRPPNGPGIPRARAGCREFGLPELPRGASGKRGRCDRPGHGGVRSRLHRLPPEGRSLAGELRRLSRSEREVPRGSGRMRRLPREEEDRHDGSLGTRCADCHIERGWSETHFDHAATRFPLTGRHRDVECGLCHPAERYEQTAMECQSCHGLNDVHLGRFGSDCGTCHYDERLGGGAIRSRSRHEIPAEGRPSRNQL